jgi:outer membrane biogenesis lipoprotein LolB
MRKTVTLTALLSAALLAACAGGTDNHPVVCAEQTEWAQNGTVDGQPIRIICPPGTP